MGGSVAKFSKKSIYDLSLGARVQQSPLLSLVFGRRKIDNPSIHGKWTKRTSKLKGSGIISIVQSTQKA